MGRKWIRILLWVSLLLIGLLALSPFILHQGAAFMTDYLGCQLGSTEQGPCVFLGYDLRSFLEGMHFEGWVVMYHLVRLAGIALLVWFGVALLVGAAFSYRRRPPAAPGQ